MKKLLTLLLTLLLVFALGACNNLGSNSSTKGSSSSKTEEKTEELDLEKLDKPVVSIDANGLATWKKVKNADGYAYVINDGKEKKTSKTEVQLSMGDSIKVKALGDGEEYEDSSYSKVVVYEATFDGFINEEINGFDSKDFDKLFKFQRYDLTTLNVQNLSADIYASGDVNGSADAALWQKGSVIYAYAVDETDEYFYSLDLAVLQEFLDDNFYDQLLSYDPSELVNMLLEQNGINMDLDDLLDLVYVNPAYFENMFGNTYRLSIDGISKTVADFANELGSDVDADELAEAMYEIFDDLYIEVQYVNGKVHTFVVSYKVNPNYGNVHGIIQLVFDYDAKGLSHVTVYTEDYFSYDNVTMSCFMEAEMSEDYYFLNGNASIYEGNNYMEVNVNINPSYANAYFKMNTNEFDTNIKFEVYCNNGLLENGHVSWYYNNYYSESFDLEIDIYGGSNATIPSVNTNNAQDLLANLYQ